MILAGSYLIGARSPRTGSQPPAIGFRFGRLSRIPYTSHLALPAQRATRLRTLWMVKTTARSTFECWRAKANAYGDWWKGC